MKGLTKHDPYDSSEWASFEGLELYLNLFELIPDDIMLTLATRELQLDNANACVCGWAVRDAIACVTGEEAARIDLVNFDSVPVALHRAAAKLAGESITRSRHGHQDGPLPLHLVPELCSLIFGATRDSWDDLFQGVVEKHKAPTIERAMMLRLLQVTQ